MKLTQKDFELFKSECQKWLTKFGMNDWKVYYSFDRLNGNFAECRYDYRDCVATISLNKEISKFSFQHSDVINSAKHEVIHLLLARFHGMAKERFINQDEIDNEWERLVRIIEKALK